MYRKHFFTYLFFSLISFTALAQNVLSTEVNTTWELSRFGIDETYPATVPGNVFTDLMRADVIPDPFVGTNEDSVQWVGLEDWTYTSGSFSVSEEILAKNNVHLTFKGLDTYANVWLNGQHILSANNYHRSWDVDVKGILKSSENSIQVNFKSPLNVGEILASETEYELPGNEIRAVTRKPQFHYGWDWGPKLVGCGIHAPIEIVGFDNIRLVSSQAIVLNTISEKNPIRFEFQVSAQEKWSGQYEIRLNDSIKFHGRAKLKPGHNTISHVFKEFANEGLWWPRGEGKQTFHKVALRLYTSGNPAFYESVKMAVRKVDLVTDKDSHGESFYFKINDEAIFCKGANYIPIDFFQNRVSKSDYDRVLSDAVEANMNMLRVWGGGIYEDEYFYDACDSLGILVWQDFMYACAMYPHQDYFIENAEFEAIEQLNRLAHHPSVVLWCGNNENSEGWHRWGWQANLSAKQKKEVWKGYKQLFQKTLPKAVADLASLPYWESSPMLGRGDPEHQYRGDAHYWGVWHDAQPFDTMNYVVPRFMSEFGFQSFPALKTIQSYTGETALSYDNPAIQSHEKHPRGFDLIEEYMIRDYGFVPDDFEDFVWLGQIQQAEGIGLGLDAHRRNAPYCMGTLYWQLNDCWPVASWSSVDYFGRWKPLHFEAKEQFQSQKLSYFIDGDALAVSLISDKNLTPGTEAKWSFMLKTMSGFDEVHEFGSVSLNNDWSQEIWRFDISGWKDKSSNHFGLFELKYDDESLTLPIDLAKPKDQSLQQDEIKIQVRSSGNGTFMLTLSSDVYTRNVWIESDTPGAFSKNNFDLIPSHPVKVQFSPKVSVVQPNFRTRSLNDLMPR